MSVTLESTLQGYIGGNLFVVTHADQLSILGQTFRPIFVGTVKEVHGGHITLYPVTIKMVNAPYFTFPTPLSIPLEKIAHFTTEIYPEDPIPLT